MAKYDIVIGLEVHVELKTDTKIFCSCSTAFGAEPNRHACPVCLGLPGSLPLVNGRVIEFGIAAGLALNCQIAEITRFDRKHYFYPDLATNYQISQLDYPIAQNGYLEIKTQHGSKRIRINRAHLEEDAGKLVHRGSITSSDYSLVDYNRAGMPLIEIVSEPDLSNADEVVAYLEKVKAIMQYIGVSDCKMEEGSLRCDANISLKPAGQTELGTKTELKNMNSFKALHKAISSEIERQAQVLEAGEQVRQETRSWDEDRGITLPLRSKGDAQDYRYFPDPDLTPIGVSRAWVEQIRNTLPELPDTRRERLVREHGLPEYDASILTSSKELADFYEQCVGAYAQPKTVSNWVMGELLRMMNAEGLEIGAVRVTPLSLARMLELVDQGVISGKIAKTIFAEMFNTGKDPRDIVQEKGLEQITDEGAVESVVDEILAANPKSVADYQSGKKQALGFLVGQVMKATKGKANPGLVNKLLQTKLE